jgi:exodeoxyribonuclease VII large subunit
MNDKLSLTELQLIIRDALYTSLPGMYWVSAEIAEIKENYSGHCYIELVDKLTGDDNIKARARAIIWANRYRMLKPFFENTTGETMKEGLRVLLKVTLEYHEIYGLSLVVSDIDPAYTIGEMAIKKLQIIRRLEKEGVIEMNKDHQFPYVPRRIAIISSENAAGYSDFLKQLNENEGGYTFYTTLFNAVMQGNETAESVINALDQISLKTESFDVVVIIRGGGSQSDLSWFDNYDIAYHITQFPLPVITGIGHEKDMTVADHVANISVKTPTALADLLINRMTETENHINELANKIILRSNNLIGTYRNKIESHGRDLIAFSKISLTKVKENLTINKIGLFSYGKDYIAKAMINPLLQYSQLVSAAKASIKVNEVLLRSMISNFSISTNKFLVQHKEKVVGAQVVLNIIDPVNVLKRGFTITSVNGDIIKTCESLKPNDQIDTRFVDGVVKSRILLKSE